MKQALILSAFLLVGGAVLAQEAVLRGTIKDAATGLPTPCTVRLTDANGRTVIESASFHGGFRSPGTFTKKLPAGHTRIRITRGFETESISREFELAAGQETEAEFVLQRRVDL